MHVGVCRPKISVSFFLSHSPVAPAVQCPTEFIVERTPRQLIVALKPLVHRMMFVLEGDMQVVPVRRASERSAQERCRYVGDVSREGG
jgi:hypothetical protein